jgi:hypothetical protein
MTMLNIKTLIAAAVLSSVAAVSFAQAPATPKDAGAGAAVASTDSDAMKKPVMKKKVAKKTTAKKVKKASAMKKAEGAMPAASAAK